MAVALHQLTDVWTSGAAYKGIALNVTDTSSANASFLMELSVNSVQAFAVFKNGWTSFGLAGSNRINMQPFDGTRVNFYNDASTEYATVRMKKLDVQALAAITADDPSIIAQSWNNVSVNFRAFRIEVTPTAAGDSSAFAEFRKTTDRAGAGTFLFKQGGGIDIGLGHTSATDKLLQFNHWWDGGSNYEGGQLGWNGGNFYIETFSGGTGVEKPLILRVNAQAIQTLNRKGVVIAAAQATTSADKALAITQTWNDAAVAFTAISANITNTASAGASLLMDLQVGGVSQFKVRKDGAAYFGTGTAGGQIYPGTGNTLEFYNHGLTDWTPIRARSIMTSWGSGKTTDLPALNLSEGWSNAAVDFTAIKLSLTDTNSGANSKLMDLLVGGVSKFAITKAGAIIGSGVREKLTANRTYYVDITTGNDTTGTGASGTPWQTLEKALFWIAQNLDLNGLTVEIKLADGTYQGATVNGDQHPWIVNGYCWIHGNNTNPENVIISGDTWEAFGAGTGAVFYLSDLKVQSTVTSTIVAGGFIVAGRPEMGGWGGRLLIGRSANTSTAYLIACSGAFDDETDTGIEIDTGGVSCGGIASVGVNGTCYLNAGVKINGNHTFTQAIFKSSGGIIELLNATPFTITGGGVITGKKFAITNGGLIRRTLGTMNFDKLNADLPGTINGTYAGVIKEVLLEDRTYYVRTDGNNANNGLADTAGGAWATLQYALDLIASSIDLNGFTITLQLNTGTHAGVFVSKAISGKGAVFIKGSTSNTTDVVISGTTTAGLDLGGSPLVTWWIGGAKLESTYAMPLNISNVRVYLGSPDNSTPAVRFGKGANVFWPMIAISGPNGYCNTWSTGTIIDVDSTAFPVGYFIQAIEGAQTSFGAVAFAATTTFSTAFVQALTGALISIQTADGVAASAIGKKYDAQSGGVIRRTTGTGGINNLPGTIQGTWASPAFTSASVNGTLSMGTGQLLSWGSSYMWGQTGSSIIHSSDFAVDATTASTSTTTGALTVAGGVGIAGDAYFGGALTASPVWNNSGVDLTGATINVTNTASGANSKILDLQVGGLSKFYVQKQGFLIVGKGDTTATDKGIEFWRYLNGSDSQRFFMGYVGDVGLINYFASGAGVLSDLKIQYNSDTVIRCRADGAALALKTSAAPQNNGDMIFERTSDTLVTAKMKGSDGTTRSAGIQVGGPTTGVVTVSTSAPSGGNDGDVWYQVT
jgi:hypothetical protein